MFRGGQDQSKPVPRRPFVSRPLVQSRKEIKESTSTQQHIGMWDLDKDKKDEIKITADWLQNHFFFSFPPRDIYTIFKPSLHHVFPLYPQCA